MSYSSDVSAKSLAKVRHQNLKISFKKSCEVGKRIRGMEVKKALEYLDKVQNLKMAVPYRRFKQEIGHKKGAGVDTGGYPVKVCEVVVKLLKSAQKNANNIGLDENLLFIKEFITTKGDKRYTPGRYSGRVMKSTNLEIVLEEKKK